MVSVRKLPWTQQRNRIGNDMRLATILINSRLTRNWLSTIATILISCRYSITRKITCASLFPICFLCLIICGFSQGEIVFKDNFKNELITRYEWIIPNQIETSVSFSEKGIALTNNHPYNSMIALHSLSRNLSTYSMAVCIVSGSPGSGFFFNVTIDKSGSYCGYAAVISYGKAELLKIQNGTISVVASAASPFIRSSENYLSISNANNCILLFCNGFYLFTVKENELSSGDCALIVQPTANAIFTDFEINSQVSDSIQFLDFHDTFDSTNCFGWQKKGTGIIENKNSLLNITTGKYQNCTYGIVQPLRNFIVKTAVKWNTGNDSTMYGLYLSANHIDDSQKSGLFKFGLNRKGQYKFSSLSDSSKLTPINNFFVNTIDQQLPRWDTITLVQVNLKLSCYLNDMLIIETRGNELINGTGVFVAQGLDIAFDNFEMKCIGLPTEVSQQTITNVPLVTIKKPIENLSFSDLLGRNVSTLKKISANRTHQLIVSKSRKNNIVLK